jgi:hypothetical protein
MPNRCEVKLMARNTAGGVVAIEAPIRKKPGPKPGSRRRVTTAAGATREAAAVPKAPKPGASAKPAAMKKPTGGNTKTVGGGRASKDSKGKNC